MANHENERNGSVLPEMTENSEIPDTLDFEENEDN